MAGQAGETLDEFIERMQRRSGTEGLPSHLEGRYGIQVARLTELDLGVFRVDRRDGPSWLARVFPAARPVAAAEGDAGILRFLEQHGFPAERCAHPSAVSVHEGQAVLVTGHIQGVKPAGSEQTFHTLGDLLGRLHTLPSGPAAVARDGGAWHHLSWHGGPRAEIAAAMALLAAAEHRVPAGQGALYEALRDELGRAEDGHDRPAALIHPDFVPANVIAVPGGGVAIIDWAGAGRGPRLSSLAFLLWAAGGRSLTRVDAAVAGYRKHIRLEPAELERLAGAIRARPLVLDSWAFCLGRQELPAVVAGFPASRGLAEAIADRAGEAFAGRAGPPGAAPAAQPGIPGPAGAPLDGVAGTGAVVAAIRAAETARPDRLFADPLADAFVAASGWSSARRPGDRRAAALRIWVVARTVFLDELLASAGQDGCRQAVLLGAGFDARAFRLPWPAGMRCFELDTADVLDRKAAVLAAQSAQPGCQRIPVACDLRGDWPAALLAAGLRPEQPTAWIAEGLLVYLSPGDVDRVLATLTGLSAPGSRLGLTMSNRGLPAGAEPGQLPGAADLRRSQAPDDPAVWLAGHGWAAQVTGAREVLRAHGRPVPEPAGPAGDGPPGNHRPRALLISAARVITPATVIAPAGVISPAQDTSPRPAVRRPPTAANTARLPLPALLSQILVAFTVECDNEFEHQMPHRTTRGPAAGSRRGPWLVSLPMWSNFLRFVTDEGRPRRELADRARLVNLAGLERWGYVVIEPDPADRRPAPPRADWILRPSPGGRLAQQVWRPLPGLIENRWQERFGAAEIRRLRASLQALASQFDVDLPLYLPVAGLSKRDHDWPAGTRRGADVAAGLDLPALLSQVLLAFTADFEAQSRVSLALSANALRVLSETGVRVRDLPRLAGVAKEAVSLSVGFLERHGLAVAGPDPAASRGRLVRLTPGGRQAQDSGRRLLGVVEEHWQARFGADGIGRLRESLEGILDEPDGDQSRLSRGLVPYPDGWRAHQPYLTQTTAMIHDPRAGLPHYPMVSHRGGFPDGS